MKLLNVGDIFRGISHTDLVNRVLETHWTATQKCWFSLPFPNDADIIAIFIYMNNTIHGYVDDDGREYKWKNKLSNDGTIINEEFYSRDIDILIANRCKRGFLPYRLAFQLDPYENGKQYTCKFVGVFCLDEFWGKNNINARYKKVLDKFYILSPGEQINNNDKFTIIKAFTKYNKCIDKNIFNNSEKNLFKDFNKLYEYLELNFDVNNDSINIIKAIQNYMKESKTNNIEELTTEQTLTNIDYSIYINKKVQFKKTKLCGKEIKIGIIENIDDNYCYVKYDNTIAKFQLNSINTYLQIIED